MVRRNVPIRCQKLSTRGYNAKGTIVLAVMILHAFFVSIFSTFLIWPTAAMVGGTRSGDAATRAVVMIVGSRGTSCTGALIARDLVLTAGHCVQAGTDYKLVEFDAQKQPRLLDTVKAERHPQFNMQTFLGHRATADVALIKLAVPLNIPPAPLYSAAFNVAVEDPILVAGYGLSERGNGKTGGTLRIANLVVTGKPGNLQLRLFDPATRNERAGLGACTGDSGAPAFVETAGRLLVIGVVSWSTGPKNEEGCGGLTGVTPLALYRNWIFETARKLGSSIVLGYAPNTSSLFLLADHFVTKHSAIAAQEVGRKFPIQQNMEIF
jgi:hypothetical protein